MPRWLVSLQTAGNRNGVAAPQVIFTAINSDHAISAVLNGEADLGFVECPSLPRRLRSRVVGRDELVVVVPPEHKWARRSAPVTALELSGRLHNYSDVISSHASIRLREWFP